MCAASAYAVHNDSSHKILCSFPMYHDLGCKKVKRDTE